MSPKPIFLEKYPRLKQIMDETGMTLEQAYIWVETECRKKGVL